MSYSTLEKELADCDLVITGEGQSDAQTLMGKVPAGIAARAAAANCPIICVSGALGIGYEKLYELGFIGIFSIADRAMSFLQALEQAPAQAAGLHLLTDAHHRIAAAQFPVSRIYIISEQDYNEDITKGGLVMAFETTVDGIQIRSNEELSEKDCRAYIRYIQSKNHNRSIERINLDLMVTMSIWVIIWSRRDLRRSAASPVIWSVR